MKASSIKVFDFFSGCGGTSAGLEKAGMEIVFALDSDHDAGRTFQRNFPETAFHETDVTKFRTKSIAELVRKCRASGSHVLFSGCAPCQPFSKQNSRKCKNDERIPLLGHFARFVRSYEPDFILVENVPGIQRVSYDTGPLPPFLQMLRRRGYYVVAKTLDCRDYGVPQKRKRFVLLASRLGPIELPEKSHGIGTPNPAFSTVREWIENLPRIAAGEESKVVKNHRASRLSDVNLIRIKATPIGGSRSDWPSKLVLACHASHTGHSDVYGRMRWDQPASGLTTRCISLSNGRFGHPTQDRAISVREAARLQTFEDRFLFVGSLNSMAKQVGNAVPVILAQKLGSAFVQQLSGLEATR